MQSSARVTARSYYVLITTNSAYHICNGVCVGVLDRDGDVWLSDHKAVAGELVAATSPHGAWEEMHPGNRPGIGYRVFFSTDVMTTPIQAVEERWPTPNVSRSDAYDEMAAAFQAVVDPSAIGGDAVEAKPAAHLVQGFMSFNQQAGACTCAVLRAIVGDQITLDFETHDNLGIVALAPMQIHEILITLAIRAQRAMPNGGRLSISVRNVTLDDAYITTLAQVKAGRYVMVAVSDTGPGKVPEVRDHFYDVHSFLAGHDTAASPSAGMATVFRLVARGRGYFSVYSERAIGTSVKIYLPRIDLRPPESPKSRNPEYADCRGVLLVVEDQEKVRSIAIRALRSAGFTVLAARSAKEAIAKFDDFDGHVDLLLTDVVLPGLSGPEVAEQLRQRQPDLRVLYMSGYVGNVADKYRLLSTRATFPQKPFTVNGLVNFARRAMNVSLS